VLHTKQFAYGDKKLLYVKWKPKALRTVVGRSKMTCGKCFGQYIRQLLRVANSLRRVAARLKSVAGASVIALVFLT
jgi:ribosome biogenesis protein Nip4